MQNLDNLILDAPQPAQRRLEYAGFWIRVVAAVVDWIVLTVVGRIVNYAFFSSYTINVIDDFELVSLFSYYFLIGFALRIGYYSVMESSARQATLGKMAVGIRVGDERGERISFMNAVGRSFAKILSALVLFTGYIMVAFDEKNQGIHDKIAGTVVYYQ
jgi:uncharacterized RDD family membrane protein YckC